MVTLAEGGLLIGPDQSVAVQKELGERWASKDRKGKGGGGTA